MSREEINRRVEVSAGIADSVYEFEKFYMKNARSLSNKDAEDFQKIIQKLDINDASLPLNTELKDYYYDPSTGVAAIAVYDSVTGETYIAYAVVDWTENKIEEIGKSVSMNIESIKSVGDSISNFFEGGAKTVSSWFG